MKQVVVITGASRGLGLSLAQRFLEQGDTVYGISRSKKYWPQAKASVAHSARFFLHALDLTHEMRVKAFLQSVYRRAKKIDILINNAGYGGKVERTETLTARELQKSLQTNLFSAFFTAKHALPFFRKQKKGLIVNVASMAGVRAVPKIFAYSAGKFGVLALSQCLAKENADWNFKALTVCPGGMNTLMRAELFGKEDANRQQSTDFVADVMMKVIQNDIVVESGGHIIIRHGKITGVFPSPAA